MGLHLTENDYQEYYSQLKEQTDVEREKLLREIHSTEARLKSISSEITDRSLGIVDKRLSEAVISKNQERIAELESTREEEEQTLARLRESVRDQEKDRLTLEQFFNLSKRADVIVKSANPIIKDEICREISLNFSMDEEKVASYQLKPPFDEMLKSRKVSTSRGVENRTPSARPPAAHSTVKLHPAKTILTNSKTYFRLERFGCLICVELSFYGDLRWCVEGAFSRGLRSNIFRKLGLDSRFSESYD